MTSLSIEQRPSSFLHTAIYNNLRLPSGTAEGPWFRLLRLKKARKGDTVHCDLIKRALYDDGRPYTALSYAWGDQAATRDLYIGTWPDPFKVTEHLEQGLQALRREDVDVYVWIDAICINQSDFDEREAQVAIMHQIFGNAAEVAIWLGTPPTRDPFRVAVASDLDGFFDLAHLPTKWWTRIWVVQECTYASSCPVVMWSDEQISMSSLLEIWNVMMESRDYVGATIGQYAAFQRFHLSWKDQSERNNPRRPLIDTLRETKDLQCRDPHDKIYALLNLIPEEEAAGLSADYRRPLSRLLEEVTWRMLKTHGWGLNDFRQLERSLLNTETKVSVDLPTSSKFLTNKASPLDLMDDGSGMIGVLNAAQATWLQSRLVFHVPQVYLVTGLKAATTYQMLSIANEQHSRLAGDQIHSDFFKILQQRVPDYEQWVTVARRHWESRHTASAVPDGERLAHLEIYTETAFTTEQGIFGFSFAKHMRLWNHENQRGLMFTKNGGVACIVKGMEVLAYCYIPKTEAFFQVVERLKAVDAVIEVPISF